MKQDTKARKRIRALYGVNKEINKTSVGEKASLAAKCENGTFVGKEREGVIIYRGIPYAKPPVGERRWKRPEPPEADDRVYEAYYNGYSPIQTEWPSEVASYYPQSEDCLYLNVWTSPGEDTSGKAVMVFFHGGSYGWGGTADPLYDGFNYVDRHRDIVLVTVGYRTGLFGFVDLSRLPGGEEYYDSPNLGILDQIESLRWVKKNIAAFGGDPDNVTIFGVTAGGGSVSLLPIIDEAKGLFKRVIGESGSVALTFSKKECASFTRKLMRLTEATSVQDLVDMPISELIEINEKLNEFNNFPQRNGHLIPFNPLKAYASGMAKDIDMIHGTNANEINYWIGEVGGLVPFRYGMHVKFENDVRAMSPENRNRVKRFLGIRKDLRLWKVAEFYNEMMFRIPAIKQVENHVKSGGRGYMYYWNMPSTVPFRKSCHAVELAYVFRNTSETIYTGTPADQELADMVGDMWAEFAKTGRPDIPGVQWEQYGKGRKTMVFSKKPKTHRVLEEQRKALYPLPDFKINSSYAELDVNVPFVYKIATNIAIVLVGLGIFLYKIFKK